MTEQDAEMRLQDRGRRIQHAAGSALRYLLEYSSYIVERAFTAMKSPGFGVKTHKVQLNHTRRLTAHRLAAIVLH